MHNFEKFLKELRVGGKNPHLTVPASGEPEESPPNPCRHFPTKVTIFPITLSRVFILEKGSIISCHLKSHMPCLQFILGWGLGDKLQKAV